MKRWTSFLSLCLALAIFAPASLAQVAKPDGTLAISGTDYAAPGVVPAGLITFVVTGTCPSGWTEVTALAGKTLFGTVAANADVGTTGGADSITPTVNSLTAAAQTVSSLTAAAQTVNALTAAAQTFTGSSTTVPALAAGTLATAWPVGVPTHSGTTATFGGNASTVVVNHLHTLATGTGSTGNFSQVVGTVDTSSGGTGGTPTQTALGTRSGNPVAGGAADYTPAGSVSITSQGTVAWPAGVPTVSGSTATGALTPLGSNAASAVTGTMNSSAVTGTMNSSAVTGTLNSFDNRSSFVKAIFCSKD